jgi:hypothetical protein
MKRLPVLAIAMPLAFRLTAQTGSDPDQIQSDSLDIQPQFSLPEAMEYVDHVVNTNIFWKTEQDSLRDALKRLLDHSREPFDSTRSRLLMQDFSQIEVQEGDPLRMDSMHLRWLNDSTFLVDPHGWNPDLYLKKELQFIYPADTASSEPPETPLIPVYDLEADSASESPPVAPDTLIITRIDTSAIV